MQVWWAHNSRSAEVARFSSDLVLCRYWVPGLQDIQSSVAAFHVCTRLSDKAVVSVLVRLHGLDPPILLTLDRNHGKGGIGEMAWFLGEIRCEIREEEWASESRHERLLELRTTDPVRGELLCPESDELMAALGEPMPLLLPGSAFETWVLANRESWEPIGPG